MQGEPVPDLTPRLQTDRLQSAKLRTFGGDIFAAGAQVIIVLPTLPPELAETVLEILAAGLAYQPQPDLPMFLKTVDRMRDAIRDRNTYTATTERSQSPAPDEQLRQELLETRLELALDVPVRSGGIPEDGVIAELSPER